MGYLTDPDTLAVRAAQQLESGPDQDLAAGRKKLEELIVTDAASSQRWSTLGAVVAGAGEIEKGRYCLVRATNLAPNSVDTLLSAATFYIQLGQVPGALPYLGRILANTSEYDDTVFNDFDALKLDFNEIVANSGVPAELPPAASYFRHLMSTGDLENARKAWVWIRPLSPDDQLAEAYVNFLLGRKLTEEAAAAWTLQLGDREPGYSQESYLLNGGFEREPEGTLFGWRMMPDDHVAWHRDDSVAHSGHSSLRIEFDGKENVNYQGVSQQVFLRPGTYRLEAFVRADGITTDEGVGLRIFNAETEKLTGTTVWKKLDAMFTIPSATERVDLQVVRHSSLRFDSHIAGRAWIDDVSLVRVR